MDALWSGCDKKKSHVTPLCASVALAVEFPSRNPACEAETPGGGHLTRPTVLTGTSDQLLIVRICEKLHSP